MAEAKRPKSVVLVAMDGGKHAHYALDFYLTNLSRKDDELIISHSVEPVYQSERYMPREEWAEALEKQHAKISQMKAACAEKLKGKGISWQFRSAKGGSAGELVCRAAEEIRATLIVLGTRGQGTIRRTILGSVSDYVVHHAHCPVCICRQ